MKKRYLILIALAVVLLPFGLNWAILCDMPSWLIPDKGVIGEGEAPKIWLGFSATYIGAIASFAMVFITWWTLKQNREQLDELKRPQLFFGLKKVYGRYSLVIDNRGKGTAYNITFKFDETSLSAIKISELREKIRCIGTIPFSLIPNQQISIEFYYNSDLFMWNDYKINIEGRNILDTEIKENYEATKNVDFQITGIYNEKYKIEQKIRLEHLSYDGFDTNQILALMYGELKGIKDKINSNERED